MFRLIDISIDIIIFSINWKNYFDRSILVISMTVLQLRKYLVDECQSEHSLQLSFKYFVKTFPISKLLSKVAEIQKTIS